MSGDLMSHLQVL